MYPAVCVEAVEKLGKRGFWVNFMGNCLGRDVNCLSTLTSLVVIRLLNIALNVKVALNQLVEAIQLHMLLTL